jgi:hypothetical protein
MRLTINTSALNILLNEFMLIIIQLLVMVDWLIDVVAAQSISMLATLGVRLTTLVSRLTRARVFFRLVMPP